MWKVTAKSESEAEILLYDLIADFQDEEWGIINAKGLINQIKGLGNIQNITLRPAGLCSRRRQCTAI